LKSAENGDLEAFYELYALGMQIDPSVKEARTYHSPLLQKALLNILVPKLVPTKNPLVSRLLSPHNSLAFDAMRQRLLLYFAYVSLGWKRPCNLDGKRIPYFSFSETQFVEINPEEAELKLDNATFGDHLYEINHFNREKHNKEKEYQQRIKRMANMRTMKEELLNNNKSLFKIVRNRELGKRK
jgi:hypothetical protein